MNPIVKIREYVSSEAREGRVVGESHIMEWSPEELEVIRSTAKASIDGGLFNFMGMWHALTYKEQLKSNVRKLNEALAK